MGVLGYLRLFVANQRQMLDGRRALGALEVIGIHVPIFFRKKHWVCNEKNHLSRL